MPTQKQIQAVHLYRVLMFEARMRIERINFILDGGTRLPEGMVRELCYLNLRMLCELIAIGCLVIHNDISETRAKKFAKEWSADKIIGQLEALHPHFYPQPVELVAGTKEIRGGNKLNALSKTELSELYGRCGDALHRGSLKHVVRSDQVAYGKIHLPDIVKWARKIEDLLGTHVIVSSDGKTIVLCVLRDAGKQLTTTTMIIEHKLHRRRITAGGNQNVTAGLRLAVFNWREAYSKALDAWNKVPKEAQDSLKAPEKPDPMVRHARP
jgi:hypothetical protein